MAWGSPVTSAKLTVTAAWEAFQLTGGGEAIISLNPRELVTIHINLDAVGVNVQVLLVSLETPRVFMRNGPSNHWVSRDAAAVVPPLPSSRIG